MKSLVSALIAFSLSAAAIGQNSTSLVINEICQSNLDQWVSPSFNYDGWVEFYNPTSSAINITGWYLSDDAEHLRQDRITQTTIVPSGGYKVVWVGSYHVRYSPKTVDSKLDIDGGTIYLSNADGQLQLSQDYPEAVSRCSWARLTDGGSEWGYCANPSLQTTNVGHKFANRRLQTPVVSHPTQIFASGSCEVSVEIPEGCTLRYTTDGSAPTERNGATSTSGQFSTTITRIYRFRLFRDGYLPSPVATSACIKSSYDIDLPILSVISTQRNFYSDSIGIFTKGRMNGRPGRGSADKCNWNQDWERPAHFDYLTSDGELLFSQEVGIERCGGWSRAWEPWSFKVKGDKVYEGHKTLDYPFFDAKPFIRSRSLQIRNGGNDNWCRVRDPFLQEIVAASGIDVDYQAYQPVAHFVNGVWKGTINMREPNNKHFVYSNYGLDDDEIDQFEMNADSGYVQMCGTDRLWKQLLLNSRYAGSNQEYYDKVCQRLDIDEFCNYMAIEFYLCNWDWPQNNVKAWTPIYEGGRFRFILFDLDGFDGTNTPFTTFSGKNTYTFDYCYDIQKRLTKEIELVTLFNNLLSNRTFRKKFIDTFSLVTYSVFEPKRCRAIIDRLATRVAHTQSLFNGGSPWDTANKLISALSSSRQTTMMTQLRNYSRMNLSGTTQQTASIQANIAEARILFNDIPVPHNQFSGRYYAPATVRACAPAGYRFVGWRQTSSSSSTLLATNATWRYYDRGSLDNTSWKLPTYNDASWSSGAAPLGYFTDGSRDYKTTLNYGSDRNNKRPTYYFRTHVSLASAPSPGDAFTLNFKVDDGFILYVNGTEAARYNMPSGNVTYSTFASTYTAGNPDTGSLDLPASLFRAGDNVIAVELHNNNATSTDVYWSSSLAHVSLATGGAIVSTDAEYTLPNSNVSLIACFEPDANASSLAPVVINEVSAGNSVFVNEYSKRNDWVELYNTTDHDIDLAGMYLTDRINKPEKYRITADNADASTIIPAHGYKVIWCDKLDTDLQLHASFKLDNDGERQVMLSAADGSWRDTLTYCIHLGTETVGRYPDGSRQVYLLTRPTIAATNAMTSYSASVLQPTPSAIEAISDDYFTDDYDIYDLSGRLITQGQGSVHALGLTSGIYLVRRGDSSIKITIQ